VPSPSKSQLTLLNVPSEVFVKLINVKGAQPLSVSVVKFAIICE